MNVFSFTGKITGEPAIRNVNGVPVLRFHVTVGTGSDMQPLWVMGDIWKRKTIDRVFDVLGKGQYVTCTGTIEGRCREQAGPLVVRVTDIIPHTVNADSA